MEPIVNFDLNDREYKKYILELVEKRYSLRIDNKEVDSFKFDMYRNADDSLVTCVARLLYSFKDSYKKESKVDESTEDVPLNAWNHIKHEWFPEWLKKLSPPKYRTIVIKHTKTVKSEYNRYYPNIKGTDKHLIVTFNDFDKDWVKDD